MTFTFSLDSASGGPHGGLWEGECSPHPPCSWTGSLCQALEAGIWRVMTNVGSSWGAWLFLGFLTLVSASLLRRQICYWMIRWCPSLGIDGSRGKSGRFPCYPPSLFPASRPGRGNGRCPLSGRFSMVIEDGVVKSLNVEPDGTGLTCSLAPNILSQL